MTDEKSHIYFTWQGENFNIPERFLDPEFLATCMQQISHNEVYASTFSQFKQFCHESLNQHSQDCFQSIFMFTLNNNIIGFLNVRVAFSDVEIDFICVDKQYRRQKVAEKLYYFFEQFVMNVSKPRVMSTVLLEVGVNNFNAIHFYEKLGFKRISIRKKYYKNNEDALVMQKCLA